MIQSSDRHISRSGQTHPQRGAGNWWLILLILVVGVGIYIWYQQQPASDLAPREIRVAQADSSGVIPVPDTARMYPGGSIPIIPGDSVSRAPFLAPSPGFQNPNTVPIGSFLDYARRMQFDAARGVELSLPADEFGRLRTVRLEPLANLRRLDSLAFAEGRVIARVRSDAALSDLSLHNGENYVWVQGQLGMPIKAEVWSTSVLTPPKALPLTFSSKPPADAPAGKDAFWTGNDSTSRSFWIVCGRGWCHS